MIRCTSAHVNLDRTRHNYTAIAEYLEREAALNRRAGHGPPTAPGIIAVVKANAYGHGAVRVARTLEEAGATWLAVADLEEGMELRGSGSRVRILIFGALSASDLDVFLRTTSRRQSRVPRPGARSKPQPRRAVPASAIT